MTLRMRTVLVLWVGCMAVGLAAAQDDKEKKGGFRGRMSFRNPGDLVSLLSFQEVKTALKLTSDEAAFVKLLEEENGEKVRKFFESQQDVSFQERGEKMREFFAKHNPEVEKQVGDILGPDRTKRLKQIRLQVNGPRLLLMGPDLQKDLGITEDQKAKLDDIRDSARNDMREIFASSGNDPEARRKAFEDYNKKQSEKIVAVLTDKQKEKWKEMQGDPIDFKLDFTAGFGGPGRRGDRPPPEKKDGA